MARPTTRLVGAAVAALVAVPIFTLSVSQPALGAGGTITVLGPNQDARPGQPLPDGRSAASLVSAQNEFESFQVAVVPDTDIMRLEVDLAGDLARASGTVLPQSNVTVYREGYATVTTGPGNDARSDGESQAGAWPDVLVPQRDYVYGQDRAWFHRGVAAGELVVLWVDVLVPAGQAPGNYTGSLRIKDGATVLHSVPLSVEVRDVALPSTSSLTNLFLTRWDKPCAAHTGHPQCGWDAELATRLHALYARVGLENRVTIANPWPVNKDQSLAIGAGLPGNSHGLDLRPLFRKYVLPLVKGTATPPEMGSQPRLSGGKLTTLALLGPSAFDDVKCGTSCVAAWKSEATAGGFGGRLVYYVCDEPFRSAERWGKCNQTHTDVSGPSGLPELVTGSVQEADDPTLGNDADSWIDVLVPGLKQLANKPTSAYMPGNQRPAYDAWLAAQADNQLWLYSSCESAGCNGPSSADQDPPWNSPYWDGWAGYGIDQPPAQARAMSWLAFEYGATGELYWQSAEKLATAWDPCTSVTPAQSSSCLYESGMMGDGTLFYPGNGCAVTAMDARCIGGTADIPLESIRLKRIRDGREDYELLRQLDASAVAADGPFAHDTALGLIGPDLDTATYAATAAVTDADIAAARLTLLDRLAPAGPTPMTISVADTSVTEGTGDNLTAFQVQLSRTGDLTDEAIVHFTLASGTATAGSDYPNGDGGQAWFQAGQATTALPLAVVADAVPEADEVYSVQLDSPPAGVTLADATADVTILDDDVPPAVWRPDALVRTGSSYLGDGVYDDFDDPGADQTAVRALRRTDRFTGYWRVQNDGNTADSYSLVATTPGRGLRVQYFRGSTRITRDVRAGTYSTGVLTPGVDRTYRVKVTATRKARRGSIHRWYLHVVSYRAQLDNADVRDIAAVKVKVK